MQNILSTYLPLVTLNFCLLCAYSFIAKGKSKSKCKLNKLFQKKLFLQGSSLMVSKKLNGG